MNENEFKLFCLAGNKEYKIEYIEKNIRKLSELEKIMIRHEDLLLKSYDDGFGNLTIGVGHTPAEKNKVIDIETALLLLDHDIQTAIMDCKKLFPEFMSFPKNRKLGLISWVFNVGYTRAKKFKKAIKYINDNMYNLGAIELLDSKWYKQVGHRAIEIAKMICDDEEI